MAHTVRGGNDTADGRCRGWLNPKFMRDLHRRERLAADREALVEALAEVLAGRDDDPV